MRTNNIQAGNEYERELRLMPKERNEEEENNNNNTHEMQTESQPLREYWSANTKQYVFMKMDRKAGMKHVTRPEAISSETERNHVLIPPEMGRQPQPKSETDEMHLWLQHQFNWVRKFPTLKNISISIAFAPKNDQTQIIDCIFALAHCNSFVVVVV